MKLKLLTISLLAILPEACTSSSDEHNQAWTPQARLQGLTPVPTNEVLVVDQAPSTQYTTVGSINGPVGANVAFSPSDQMQFFKETAAAMGGNTVVLTPASHTRPTKVNVLYVKEEAGAHGGDEF